MKTVLPHALASPVTTGKGAVPRLTIAKLLATRQVGNALVVPIEKGSANQAGCSYERAKAGIREIAAREDTTVQALLAEAMNMLFVARGLPEIAER